MIRIKSKHTDILIPDQKLNASTSGEEDICGLGDDFVSYLYVSVSAADPALPYKVLGQTPIDGALEISYEDPAGPSEDSLQRIVDAHWSGGGEGIDFIDIYQHNACNHTLSGIIQTREGPRGFVVESGDRHGTRVQAWGDPEDVGTYTPPPPSEPKSFIPRDERAHGASHPMFHVYLAWRKEPWFRDKERSYNYDRHFQPGGFIESHYQKWAEAKGMRVGFVSSLPNEARAAIAKAEARS